MPLVRAPRLVALLLGSLAAVAMAIGVSVGQAALVAPLSKVAVEVLLRLSAPLSSAAVPEPALADPPAPELALQPDTLVATKAGAKRAARPAPVSKASALFVSGAQVLALAQSQARPSGRFVGPAPGRPPGLLLAGVGSLGIGLQDGDVLIEALGSPPTSAGQVIGAIIEARAKRAPYSSGVIWRKGQTFRITVEQPYPSALGLGRQRPRDREQPYPSGVGSP